MSCLAFASYSASAIFLTPFLVRHLGNSAYGLIPLAGLFTQYSAIISAQLSGAVNRFLALELQKENGRANVVFNSALCLYLILIVLQIPLMIGLIFSLNFFFSIPAELYHDTVILFSCSSAAFLISMLDSVFGLPVFAFNRLDISSSLDLGKQVLRFCGIIIVFLWYGVALRYIGYIDLALALMTLSCNFYFCRRFAPNLKIQPKEIRFSILGPIFKMSFWTLLDNLGSLLFLRSDIWIINRFISAQAAGQYAALLVISNFIKQIGMLLGRQIAPSTMTLFAQKRLPELQMLLKQTETMLPLAVSFPIAIVTIFSRDLLTLWLNPGYAVLAPVLIVTVVHLIANATNFPLFYLYVAMNKVKLNGIILIILGIVNVMVVYLLGITFGLGLLGVAIGGGLVLGAKNAIFTPLYGAYLLRLPKTFFFRTLKNGILSMVLTCVVGFVIHKFLFFGGWSSLLLCMAVTGAFSLIGVWFLVLPIHDRIMLLEYVPKRFRFRKKSLP